LGRGKKRGNIDSILEGLRNLRGFIRASIPTEEGLHYMEGEAWKGKRRPDVKEY